MFIESFLKGKILFEAAIINSKREQKGHSLNQQQMYHLPMKKMKACKKNNIGRSHSEHSLILTLLFNFTKYIGWPPHFYIVWNSFA